MAITILKRPENTILDQTEYLAGVTDASGDANFNDTGHGFSTNDLIYISSEVEDYNGFWYVNVTDSDNFRVRRYTTSSVYAGFISLATVSYRKGLFDHGFSCVHLPITYKISNDKWPTNSVDTVRTISSIANNNGFCKLTVSGDIRTASPPDDLDFVEIQTGTLAGIYQIVELISNTVFTINLVYTSANATELSSKNIQYYYNNYKVRVKVWAGVNSWATIKPYENIVELELTPDENNIIDVNINEYLKQKIKPISNNLLLGTFPNDIDSFTEFFIETTEAYDKSDYGNLLTTYVAPYASDQANLQGVAVNSMLQFKNLYSGFLSEYLGYNSYSKFLTLFDEPRYFIGSYYDICFLAVNNSIYSVKREAYLDSVLQSTSYEDVYRSGKGLYRYPLSLPSGSLEDRIDLTLMFNQSAPAFAIPDWANGGNPAYRNWLIADGSVTLTTALPNSKIFYTAFTPIPTVSYSIDYNIDLTDGSSELTDLNFGFYDADFNVSAITSIITSGTGNYSGTLTLKVSKPFTYPNPIYFGVEAYASSIAGASIVVDIASITFNQVVYSETKTINVDSECSFQDIYLTWKNYLGGMDYWKFTAQKDYIAEIEGTTETTENIFPDWPNSYGEFADTIDKETSRTSRDKIVVRSQNMTESEMNAVRYILSSPLVQIMVSKSDRRTVKVSKGSFTWKRDEDKLYSVEFEISYTNTIPSQSL